MKPRLALITVGLGFGDEGKGAACEFLVRKHNASLVIRYSGGCQAGHNVVLPDGRHHTFSQFGAGTFAGAETYLGQHVIISPIGMAREALALKELGVSDTYYSRLSLHPRCLVTTPYHCALNRLKELGAAERHGSCGWGIGETRKYWLEHGMEAIFAQDLIGPYDDLVDKLELLRQRLIQTIQPHLDYSYPDDPRTSSMDAETLKRQIEEWVLDMPATAISDRLRLDAPRRLQLQPPNHEVAVYEGAQGILLDEWYGLHPYTTWSTVTPRHAVEIAKSIGTEHIEITGVTRAYQTRHGNGPLPTAGSLNGMSDVYNKQSDWQGDMRFGALDLMLLRYSSAVCQQSGGLDNIAINCLDQVSDDAITVCQNYSMSRWEDRGQAKLIEKLAVSNVQNLKHQEQLTFCLSGIKPNYSSLSKSELIDLIDQIAPVTILGYGPTYKDHHWWADL